MCVPVRMTNVSVSVGGLQSHDMRVLQLLRTICNGTLAANTGLTTVTYIPGELVSGNFSAEAGRLGYVAKMSVFPEKWVHLLRVMQIMWGGGGDSGV